MCNAWLSIDYTASTASILNLFVLSLDRYWSITSPLKYLQQRTKRRAFFMIAAAWLLSLLWILPVTGWNYMVNNGTRQNLPSHTCNTAFAHNVTFKVCFWSIPHFQSPLTNIFNYSTVHRVLNSDCKQCSIFRFQLYAFLLYEILDVIAHLCLSIDIINEIERQICERSTVYQRTNQIDSG